MGKSGKWKLHPEVFNLDCINLAWVRTLPPLKLHVSVPACLYVCELTVAVFDIQNCKSLFYYSFDELILFFEGASYWDFIVAFFDFYLSHLAACCVDAGSICICIVSVCLCQCAYCERALKGLWDLWKGLWVIGTRQKGVMWMTFSTLHPSSVIELAIVDWGQSVCRWYYSDSDLSLRSLQSCTSLHVASLRLLCQISLPVSTCLTLPASVFSVSQPQSSLPRRCCSAIMSTGKSTRLLRWSWAASWATRLPGGLTYRSN